MKFPTLLRQRRWALKCLKAWLKTGETGFWIEYSILDKEGSVQLKRTEDDQIQVHPSHAAGEPEGFDHRGGIKETVGFMERIVHQTGG